MYDLCIKIPFQFTLCQSLNFMTRSSSLHWTVCFYAICKIMDSSQDLNANFVYKAINCLSAPCYSTHLQIMLTTQLSVQ